MNRIKDGGAAFPRPIGTNGIDNFEEREVSDAQDGMSLRDYFAAKALPAVMAARVAQLYSPDRFGSGTGPVDSADMNQESIAEECYELADALLLERDQPASKRRTA